MQKPYSLSTAVAVIFALYGGLFAVQSVPDLLTAAFSPRAEAPADPAVTDADPAERIDEYVDLVKMEPLPPEKIDTETLWLARAIYSETKRPKEQELVAWVVRNRVETRYRGNSTYREVVLDPYQFSAFNPDARRRSHLFRLSPSTSSESWQRTLRIAHYVRHQDAERRPFSIKTRHFFSERSMLGGAHPNWAETRKWVVSVNDAYNIDERRFRFYQDIS